MSRITVHPADVALWLVAILLPMIGLAWAAATFIPGVSTSLAIGMVLAGVTSAALPAALNRWKTFSRR